MLCLTKTRNCWKMAINKKRRKQVFDKCNGRCAYCGCEITEENFQIDHVTPKRYVLFDTSFDVDNIDNLLPACSVCNHYKRALDIEKFRHEWLGKLHLRIKRIPKNPRTERGKRKKEYMERILNRYGITEDKPFNKIFYFEK